LGGYGQLKYKNLVQRYRLATKQWEIIKTGETFFPPRYLSALGLTRRDTAYIMGGYGSPTGDQMLNRQIILTFLPMTSGGIHLRSSLISTQCILNSLFANSLIIDSKDQQYYGLVFPNDSF